MAARCAWSRDERRSRQALIYSGWSFDELAMLFRMRRLLKWMALVLLTLTVLVVSRDALRFNVAEEAAAPYRFDLVKWQAANFFSKWVHRLASALPWNSESLEERQHKVMEYFQRGQESSRLKGELEEASARTGDDASLRVKDLEERLDEIRSRRNRLRNDIEETLEATISSVISEEGLGAFGEFIFPPVDIRLTEPPKLLVTSPRDRIQRTHDVLLKSEIRVEQREEVEQKLLERSDLSALVVDIGGLATFPASLPNDQPLRWTLQTSAHEWLHHYFFFRPLGQNLSKSGDMQTLNETMANIAGREIGDRAFEMLGGRVEPEPLPRRESEETPKKDDAFDFDAEMRETRLRVDELLAEGSVEEAEAYMEERRKLFLENGFNIRKFNQAYFAFHGTYAESPTSVSPIGDQLHRFRDLMPDLGAFIRTMSGVSSYQGFLDKLERREAQPAATGLVLPAAATAIWGLQAPPVDRWRKWYRIGEELAEQGVR